MVWISLNLLQLALIIKITPIDQVQWQFLIEKSKTSLDTYLDLSLLLLKFMYFIIVN